VDILCRVGHGCGSDLEEVATVVTARQRLNVTVVDGTRLGPGDHGTTVTGVVRRSDVAAETQNDRVFVVTDGDVEGAAELIAVDIDSRVGHGRGSNLEEVTTVVTAGQGLDSAVVLGGRLRPADHGATGTGIVGRGNVTAEAQNLRVLCVDHGHREGLGHLITVNVFRFVENLSGTHREGRTAVVTAGDIDEITVVSDRRLVPGHDCSAITGVVVDGEITGQATDDRAFLIIDGHVEGSTDRVAVDIDGREGHGFGSHFEVGSADMRLGEGLDFAVVLSGRLSPADIGTTLSQIIRDGDIEAEAQNLRVLVVAHRNIEGAADHVAVDIHGGVGHGRGSDFEEVATVVTAGQRLNVTVVDGSRLGPADNGTTGTGVIG